MKVTITKKIEVDIKYLQVSAGVRYWEDSEVNGVPDEGGDLIPCRKGDSWQPKIQIESGKIVDWPIGTTANIHYKVCDDGVYILQDAYMREELRIEGYVPGTLSPAEDGYGDYIIMEIDENGYIKDWDFNIEDFQNDDDE